MSPEDFDFSMSEAAHVAAKASYAAMRELAAGRVFDEDDVTGELVGELNAALRGRFGKTVWQARILRHRSGRAGEELKYGADILFHFSYKDADRSFSKGVLVQSKKVQPLEVMSPSEHKRLMKQCDTMLGHSPASYVFDYDGAGMRVTSANKTTGLSDRRLYPNCEWTPYRFFYEFFRCPVGDRNISTTHINGRPIEGDSAAKVDHDSGLPAIVKFAATGLD